MKAVIAWIKSNPITLVSAIVVLASLGAMGYLYQRLQAISADTAVNRAVSEISGFMNKSVELPPRELGQDPVMVSGVTFNAVEFERIEKIFRELSERGKAMIETVEAVNKAGHRPMLDGLFPQVAPDKTNLFFEAQQRYKDILALYLGSPEEAASRTAAWGWDTQLPALNAGLPPTPEELGERLARIAEEASRAFGDTITEQQAQEIESEQRSRLIQLLRSRARQINIYADPRLLAGPRAYNPGFPLSVMQWANEGAQPQPWQLWEGQMELWVHQNIIQALANVNRVGGTFTNANGDEVPASVLEAPVKRLIELQVLPMYVGLQTVGGVGQLDPEATANQPGGRAARGFGVTGSTAAAVAPAPPAQAPIAADAPMPLNYYFGPSGRYSNALYDVRHARVRLHADYARLPELYRAIGEVNLMTVIDARIYGVDEFDFAGLGGTYLYGRGDIVEVELVIETAWLRSWTEPLMPQRVKEYVGAVAPEGGFGGGAPGMGGMGGMGF